MVLSWWREFNGAVLRDAGVDYVFADDKHSGSLTFSPEKVIEKAANADWWLFVNSSAGHLDRNGLLTEMRAIN